MHTNKVNLPNRRAGNRRLGYRYSLGEQRPTSSYPPRHKSKYSFKQASKSSVHFPLCSVQAGSLASEKGPPKGHVGVSSQTENVKLLRIGLVNSLVQINHFFVFWTSWLSFNSRHPSSLYPEGSPVCFRCSGTLENLQTLDSSYM